MSTTTSAPGDRVEEPGPGGPGSEETATEPGSGAGSGDETEVEDAEATPAEPSALSGLIHGGAHLVVWGAVLVPTIGELARGWRPFGDDAAIASRAYQVFSVHPPLVGLFSAASYQTGHVVFAPGPMLFYLLSIPVRVDPAHGLLWGAALWCGLALSLAVEAAWSVGRWVGAAVVAFVVVDMLWLTPQVFENLAWNAYFPVPFLICSVALAWMVATGSTGWWPVLVVVASVAAQSHLFFVVPALALVAVSLGCGLFSGERPRHWRWIVVGLALGIAVWLGPIVQQFEGPHGNLSAILNANQGPAFGLSLGLREIGLAASLHPVWLTHLPVGFLALAHLESAHGAWYGGMVIVLLALVAAWALASSRRALGALSALACAGAIGLAVSFAIFPTKNVLSLGYLVDSLWAAGILVWVVAAWALLEAGLELVARRRPSAITGRATWATGAAEAACTVAFAGIVAVAVFGLRPVASHPEKVGWTASDVTLVARAVTDIERAIPPEAVSIDVVSPDFLTRVWSDEAIAYQLNYEGWVPGTSGVAANYTGFASPPGPRAPTFVVTLNGTQVASVSQSG